MKKVDISANGIKSSGAVLLTRGITVRLFLLFLSKYPNHNHGIFLLFYLQGSINKSDLFNIIITVIYKINLI